MSWKDLPIPLIEYQKSSSTKNPGTFKMAENAQVGNFTSLGDPILTNYTIFRKFKARPIQ